MNPTIFVDLVEDNSKIILTQADDATTILLKKRINNIDLINEDNDSTNVYYGEVSNEALQKFKSFDNLTVIYRDVTPD